MADLKRFSFWTYYNYVTEDEYPVDQTAMVLNLHISTEYWLDRLIQHRCKLNDEELDAFDLGYAKKLRVLRKTKTLSEEISRNLKILNDLRNRFAHRLDYVLGQGDADFTFGMAGFNVEHYKEQLSTRDGLNWKKMLVDIGKITLEPLETYCLKEIGLPEPIDGQ